MENSKLHITTGGSTIDVSVQRVNNQYFIPGKDGICTGEEYYSDSGVKQYDVFQYCKYAYATFYYDEEVQHANMCETPQATWVFPLSDTRFFRVVLGMSTARHTKSILFSEIGPLVFSAAIEDFKEGAFYWRSWNMTPSTDNNRYYSFHYAGIIGGKYTFETTGVEYSGAEFTYRILVDPAEKSISMVDANGTPVEFVNQFNDGYSLIR